MNPDEPVRRRISLDLSDELVAWLDGLKGELGLRSRGAILEHVLGEIGLHPVLDEEGLASGLSRDDGPDSDSPGAGLDESSAIVLICSSEIELWDQEGIPDETDEVGLQPGRATGRGGRAGMAPSRSSAAAGIQLPGFVRSQARAFGRSLQATHRSTPERSLALISDEQLSEALARAGDHWREVYGQAPTEPALEAAMVWLGRDVWPQSDQSDGRPFTWSLTQRVVQSFAPGWNIGDATLERVITAAGVLEDPFSGTTLPLRVPTLITRFVQRHRSRRKRTTSFEAIDHTMTVHTALRLLQLPTTADRPYTLQEIREAYREQAQDHHPDAGGSADAMRRLNEAYQFLKERYRRAA